jgi:predicted cupin superfamily sugar epimerase
MNKESLINQLQLLPLAGEGGLFAPIYRDELSNAIYFMVVAPDFSAWHRLPQSELWIHVAGDPLALHTIESNSLHTHNLSLETETKHYRVPSQTWMAAESLGEYSLMTCFLAPAFISMELAERSLLLNTYPSLTNLPDLFHE